MQIDRVHFYVEDAKKWRDWFVRVMGFQAIASGSNSHTLTEVVSSGSPSFRFVLSSPLVSSSPVAQFLQKHPPGVADLAFEVKNIELAINRAIKGGAEILHPIKQRQFSQGQMRWCQIAGSPLNHTLVERTGVTPPLPQNWLVQDRLDCRKKNFTAIDHVVFNVAAGELEKTVSWYEAVLGFQRQQTFTIQSERSALYSQVMVHPTSGVQFPVNEPMSANSQIQEFLDLNRGAGIQHIALKTAGIAQVTKKLRAAGLSFLNVPANYYTQLNEKPRHNLSTQEWQEILDQEILIDYQDRLLECGSEEARLIQPLLLQIFTQPIFSQPTFFFELIERRSQAKGFGEGNFRALFEAIEREQLKRESLNNNS